jgi:predicted ATPase
MKLRKARIDNFKGVKECEIDFLDSATPRRITAILGDNGSGKTTVLQAIGLLLSLASRKSQSPETFAWHGFLAERLGTLGVTHVELDVEFDDEERKTTLMLFDKWEGSLSPAERSRLQPKIPHDERYLTLSYSAGEFRCNKGPRGLNQFAGREYIRALVRTQQEYWQDYRRVGDVFWYDQMRNIGRILHQKVPNGESIEYPETWTIGMEQLREFLIVEWSYHLSGHQRREFIPEIEKKLNHVFPDLRLRGSAPKYVGVSGTSGVAESYFFMERDGKQFDISEMSSGEQAVFPLIYEFVRLSIAKSIVLIDELELHLHPPEQQRLLTSLRQIGPDCQFIITTHSPFLEGAIPREEQVRLKGGTLCL